MGSPEITREDVEDLKRRVNVDIADNNKAAAIGSLYQFAMNISAFLGQNKDTIAAEKQQMHEELFAAASSIMRMEAEMDAADEYMFSEAYELVIMSFEENGYDAFLQKLKAEMQAGHSEPSSAAALLAAKLKGF